MIQVDHISKSFEGRRVLKDISLTINDGDTMAIIGRSGSGKSVLMKHLVGLIKPDAGRVLVDGKDINAISYSELRRVRKQFGVLFQGGALFDSMSVAENVAFPLRKFTDKTEEQVQHRVDECLDLVHLTDAARKKPSEISGGMQKRAALARAIALEPRYMIYDEPTSGLDPETSNAIDVLIRQLDQELNVTGIVVTHDMHSVLNVAERIAFVHDGDLRWVGTLKELHSADDEVLLAFVKANEYQIGHYVPLPVGTPKPKFPASVETRA